jgi:AcrR family transcriptional regulator
MAIATYHHGDLANAVIAAGLRRVKQRGLEAVSGRELAGAAGVAPSAIYRHFADKDQLRAAISQAAREQLARSMVQPPTRNLNKARAAARFRAIGAAYVDFALREPRLYAAAFAECAPPSREDNPSAWAILAESLDALVVTGAMPKSRRGGAEVVAWSSVHGISTLLPSPLRGTAPSDRKLIVTQVLDGVTRSLQITG